MTSLHDLYDALKSGTLHPENPTAAIAALDLVSHLYDLPLAALEFEAPRFAEVFPRDEIPEIARPIFKGERMRYRAFRNAILDCQMLAAPGDVDGEPRHSLVRVGRLCLGKGSNALYAVTRSLPPGVSPCAMTREFALSIDVSLEGGQKAWFRQGLGALDSLHGYDLARRSGLLLPARIGRLPTVRDHAQLEPLPGTLLALRGAASRPTQNAIDYLWRLAVAGGVFRRGDDPSPAEVAGRFLDIARLDPEAHGLSLSDRARAKYLHKFAQSLVAAGCADPRLSTSRVAWRRLKVAVRDAGIDPERLRGVARPAVLADLGPQDVTPEWCEKTLAGLDRMGANAFRTSAYLLDALHGDNRIPASLLPAKTTGLTRLLRPRGSPKPPPAPRPEAPSVTEWRRLFAEARAKGFDDRALGPLSTLRVRAIDASLAPRDLSVDWIVDLLNREALRNRAAIYASTRLLDEFAAHPGLAKLVPTMRMASDVVAERRDRRPLHDDMLAELTETMDWMGMSASGRREAAAATMALAEVSGNRPNLDALLAQDLDAFDWSPFAGRAAAYKLVLDRVRVFRGLPWSDGWRALQRAVVAAGVPMRENPVPRLLPYARGREPVDLDAAWAAETDRTFRSTLVHPPHGRADLAITFANNVGRLDRLHDQAEVAGSGLLPSRIGDYRPKSGGSP
jgi:hypothetical protein